MKSTKEVKVTGVMVQYYVTCTRELWFYIQQVNMNYDNEDITLGKLLHEKSYKREKKEVRIDNIVIDFIREKDELTIFEVKKSSKLPIGATYQLYYYLWTLKQAGIISKGMLVYPKERKKEEIILTKDKEEEINQIIKNINEIANKEKPPKAKQSPFCKNCSFYELCMI